MKHDGISVFGFAWFCWEGGILEQVGTSAFKPGRGRDDEHFLNLTILMNQYHFELWVIISVFVPVSYISWLCIVWKIWRGVRSIAESKRDLVVLSPFSMAFVLKICTEKCTWSAPPCKGQQTSKQTSKQTNKQPWSIHLLLLRARVMPKTLLVRAMTQKIHMRKVWVLIFDMSLQLANNWHSGTLLP